MSQSSNASIYREVLLDHFHHPRGKAEFAATDSIARGSNPQCGDEVEIALGVREDGNTRLRFKGRGCSVCLASASIMVDACSGLALSELKAKHAQSIAWLLNESDAADCDGAIGALDIVRTHPARSRCVLLAWEALGELLSNGQSGEV